jgi:hypothetical protein
MVQRWLGFAAPRLTRIHLRAGDLRNGSAHRVLSDNSVELSADATRHGSNSSACHLDAGGGEQHPLARPDESACCRLPCCKRGGAEASRRFPLVELCCSESCARRFRTPSFTSSFLQSQEYGAADHSAAATRTHRR